MMSNAAVSVALIASAIPRKASICTLLRLAPKERSF